MTNTFAKHGAHDQKAGAKIFVEEMVKAVYVAFEPGLRPVLKHGTHDQLSHGRRGGASSLILDAGVAQSIVDRVRANGGLSVSMVDGSEPIKGFMVAKGGKQSAIVDADEFYDPVKGPEAMGAFLKENRELSTGAYLGLWHNQADGKVYLDVSENITDRDAAISTGRKRDQISIWDVANFEEIDTGGTGQVGKTVASSQIAGSVEDDGWGDRRLREDSVGDVRKRGVVLTFAPGLRPVLKHATHDQKSHGARGGTAREVKAVDNDSAWEAVLTDEARAIANRQKAHPERYNPSGQIGYGLKDGAVEIRVVRDGSGPPRVQEYETNTSAGLTISETSRVPGSLGIAVSGYGKPLVPVGDARPPQHVYRVMSTAEFDAAQARGFIQSDQQMNLGRDEGTVTSLRSTGNFYAPTDGSDYRVVRIRYDDSDGWWADTDSYIKTPGRVPFERVDMYTSPVSQVRVAKHGTHDQLSHGRWSSASSASSRLSPGAAGVTSESAAEQLRGVPGQFTAPGGGTIETRSQAEEPGRRLVGRGSMVDDVEAQQDAVARALKDGDFSGLNIGPSRVTQKLGTAAARVERRIRSVAERIGIQRKKQWDYTEEEATALRESYYARFGKPTWMDKAIAWVKKRAVKESSP